MVRRQVRCRKDFDSRIEGMVKWFRDRGVLVSIKSRKSSVQFPPIYLSILVVVVLVVITDDPTPRPPEPSS